MYLLLPAAILAPNEIEKLERETAVCRKQLNDIESILKSKNTSDTEK